MWITPGSIEIEGRTMNGDAPITAEMWRQVARSYDPDFREASIIAAPEGATKSAHVSGKYGPRLGKIRAVKFDGVFAWIDFEPTRVYRALVEKNGGMFPSVGLRTAPDLEGNPWYLDHVAALGGETPATPNLDRFRSTKDGEPKDPAVWRSQTTASKEIAVDEDTKTKAPEAAAAEPDTKTKGAAESEPEESAEKATEPEAESRSADEIARAAVESVFRSMGLEPRKVEAEKPAEDDAVLRAVSELTKTVKAQGAELEKMRAEAAKREREAKTQEVKRTLDELAGQGRIRTAEVGKLAGELAGLSEEGRETILRSMQISESPSVLGSEVEIETEEGTNVVHVDENRYRSSDRTPTVSRSAQAEIEKLRAACTGEDGKTDQRKFEQGLIALRRKGVA